MFGVAAIGAMSLLPIRSKAEFRTIALALVLALASNHASADAQNEREVLARLVNELEALEPLLDAAEAEANPDARVRFRYDWLRADLRQIESGIQDHIEAPHVEPRTFPPLRGDYRQ